MTSAPPTEQRRPTRRAFVALWAANSISSAGDGAYIAAAPLLAATLTRDPLAVSFVTVATTAPWFLVGPFAGAWVDRLPRRSVMIVVDLIRALMVAGLTVAVATHTATIALLAICGFLMTSGQSFHSAAAQAVVPALVGRDRTSLAEANSRLTVTETLGTGFVGPPAGGALFALSGWLPFGADALSFAGSAALLSRVPKAPAPRTQTGVLAAIREGAVWLGKHRGLLQLALIIAAGNLAYNAVFATFVLLAHDKLGVGKLAFGVLLAALAVGSVLGGWLAPRLARRYSHRTVLLTAQGAKAIALVIMATAMSPWVAGAGLAIVGMSTTLATVAVVSARQELVPDELLGRVVTAFRVIGNGAAPLGALLGGLLASVGGLRLPGVAAGVFLAVIVLAAAIRHRDHNGASAGTGDDESLGLE